MSELYEKVVVTSGRADKEKGMIVTESINFYPVNGIIIPEDATNGDMIKAMFPNASVYEHGSTYSVNNEYNFNSTWWNTPYKRGEE